MTSNDLPHSWLLGHLTPKAQQVTALKGPAPPTFQGPQVMASLSLATVVPACTSTSQEFHQP